MSTSISASLRSIALVALALTSACGGGASTDEAREVPAVADSAALAVSGDQLADVNDGPAPASTPTEQAPPSPPNVPDVAPGPEPVPAPEPAPTPVEAPAQEPAPILAPAPSPGTVPTPVPEPVPDAVIGFDAGEALVATDVDQTERLDGVLAAAATDSYGRDPGRMHIQYQGGDASERLARLIAEPARPNNRVLHFQLKSANVRDEGGVPVKGRIQLNATNTEKVRAREVRFSARMYLLPAFERLRALRQSFTWLMVSEWWNNAGWNGQGYPFRISLNITKPAAAVGAGLYFSVRAQTLDAQTNQWQTPLWQGSNLDIEVPIGRWVTLEYYLREGNAGEGRFYMAMVPEGAPRRVLFDIRGWTHHPDDPAPDGLTHLNPLKLYTSKSLIDYVRNSGGALEVYWDDLSFRLCRQRFEEDISPCGPSTFN